MSHTHRAALRRLPPVAISRPDPADEALSMRLLRHHTKNALQRIIAQLAKTELRATPAGDAVAEEVERRIRLSARVSDALFGLTEVPGPMIDRLGGLADGVVGLMADSVQTIKTEVEVVGACPPALEALVLQVAHEMLTNAVKHGMHMRSRGEIQVLLSGRRPGYPHAGVTLTVRDDGWGAGKPRFNEGLTVLEAMAARHGGTVTLTRDDDWTVARLRLPGAA